MKPAYYNEIDPYAAQHLRNLIASGLIAPGDVDERSIEDVAPDDLTGYGQCHFFAGVGVWSYALRRAGVPDDFPVWTGSCPCQPFSAAGKGAGFADERHLWPAFHWLISQCRPAVILGEQVASKNAEPWIDLVHADLEVLDYAFGCVPFPSASVGAPHIRDRLYWVAHAEHGGLKAGQPTWRRTGAALPPSAASGMEHTSSVGRERRETTAPGYDDGRSTPERAKGEHGVGIPSTHRIHQHAASPVNGFWSAADWLLCRDGKWRPVEPGTFPLAHGAPARVGRLRADWRTPAGKEGSGHRAGRLRAYGNAIVAPQAEAFIRAVMETA